MSIQNSFLLEIIQSPDDDRPRLVYADWLEEHGDRPRAEFIRVQCRLADPSTYDVSNGEKSALLRRQVELLDEHGWAWAEQLGPEVHEWQFRRGFVERVTIALEDDPEHLIELFQKAPIRHIRDMSQFCEFQNTVDLLPYFDRLTGLEYWGLYAFDDALLRTILGSHHLANLRTLILHHDRDGNLANEEVIVHALGLPHRAKLEELAVSVDGRRRGPSCKILKTIAASPYLSNLKALHLSSAGDTGNNPQMNLETIQALGESPNLAGLEWLDLGRTSFSLECWEAVRRWPFMAQLQFLRLHNARQINPPNFVTIAEIRNLRGYREAFEELAWQVDWDSPRIAPWEENASWRGRSWFDFKQRHLFAMWQYLQRRDFDGLEAKYRADCTKFAGAAAAQAVAEIPFEAYTKALEASWRHPLAAASNHRETRGIYLRIRPDIEWQGELHVSTEAEAEPFQPHDSHSRSYLGPLAEFLAPSLPQASETRRSHRAKSVLDPDSCLHYLLARTYAAVGRSLRGHASPLPIYCSTMNVVFRMA